MRGARRIRHGRADQGDPSAGAGSSDRSCHGTWHRGSQRRRRPATQQGNAIAAKEEETMQATWKPFTEHGDFTTRSNLPDSVYAFPKQKKEPLTDANHVRNAVARFDQVEGVSDADRDLAFANIRQRPSIMVSTCARRAGASSAAARRCGADPSLAGALDRDVGEALCERRARQRHLAGELIHRPGAFLPSTRRALHEPWVRRCKKTM